MMQEARIKIILYITMDTGNKNTADTSPGIQETRIKLMMQKTRIKIIHHQGYRKQGYS
jgi:hypothetical protein